MLKLNPHQEQLFEALASHLGQVDSRKSVFLRKLKSPKSPLFYVMGKVGRGKTAVVKMVLSQFKTGVFIQHQDPFVRSLFDALAEGESIKVFSKKLSLKYKIIFIDEFQIKDVAEGIVLINTLLELSKRGSRVILTGNSSFQDLKSKFRIFPELLKKLIDLEQNTTIFFLEGEIDYRALAHSKKHYFLNTDQLTFEELFKIKTNYSIPAETKISLYERQWILNQTCQNTVYLSFKEGFESPRSMADYQELTRMFKVIFVENVPRFTPNHLESLRRFITFIDCVYDQNVELYILGESLLDDLFTQVQNSGLPFERTLSRLKELTGGKEC